MRNYISPEIERKKLDEEAFLRSLGIDEFDIEMVLNSKQERKKWRN